MFDVVYEKTLKLLEKLVFGAVKKRLEEAGLNLRERRRVKRRIEDAIETVVEPLAGFMVIEKIDEGQCEMLLHTCASQLQPLMDEPERLFRGSLDGTKIYAELHPPGSALPQEIREEGLENVYELLMPRVADVLCRFPPAIREWERETWHEGYRRLDELAAQLAEIMRAVDQSAAGQAAIGRAVHENAEQLAEIKHTVDESAARPERQADALFRRIHRLAAQNIQLDATGLRAGQVVGATFDALYVAPALEVQQPGTEGLRRMVVEGAPGAGKSTWTKWLQLESLRDPAQDAGARGLRLPIRVELRRETSDPLPSIQDLVRREAGTHEAEAITYDRVRGWLDSGQVLVILDGFDEVAPGRRDAVRAWMDRLAAALGQSELVVTSRPLTTTHLETLGPAWSRHHIQAFDEPRVLDYIERWYRHVPLLSDQERDVDAQELAEQWSSDPTIAPLTGNPLLLSTLLMVHHLDGGLPRGRAALYERYVDGMLGLWDARRKIDDVHGGLTREHKHRALRELALHMQFAQRDQLDEEVTRAVVFRALPKDDAVQVLAVLRERTGLLVGPGAYSFVHRSVAEYLVAEALVQGDQRGPDGERVDRLQLFEHRHDDRWRTVLYLWIGLAPNRDAEKFIRLCIDSASPKDVSLAIGLMADRIELLDTAVVDELMKALTHVSDDSRRPSGLGQSLYAHAAPSEFWAREVLWIPHGDGPVARGSHVMVAYLLHATGLSWDGCAQLRGWMRYLFARAARYVGGPLYRAALEDLCQGDHHDKALVGYFYARSLLGTDEAERHGIREVVRTHLPLLAAGEPFLLMGHLAWMTRDTDSPLIIRVLSSLARVSVESLDPTWLRWSDSFRDVGKKTFDVLAAFESWLARHEADFPDQVDVPQLKALVQAMKRARAALPPEADETP